MADDNSQSLIPASDDYEALLADLRSIIETGQGQAVAAVNVAMVQTYWHIGERIVRQEQQGQARAGYGENLLNKVGQALAAEFGRGFALTNLKYMRQFYVAYPNRHALRDQLSWTHYRTLMRLDPELRQFYEQMTITQRWSSRQLDQQIGSQLHNRIAGAKNIEDARRVMPLGQGTIDYSNAFKDPYILDFLGLESEAYSEKDLEAALIRNMEKFLLELGAGFTFMARQQRLTIGGEDFYADLVLYHRYMRCVVVVELKLGDFKPEYKGQMELYLEWFRRYDKAEGEADPIGLILCGSKNQQVVDLMLNNPEERIQVSQYLTTASQQAIREHLARIAEMREQLEEGRDDSEQQ